MNIIGYHISDVIANSNGEVCSEPPYLEWLLQQGNRDTIQVLYHMDYDIANLMRLIKLTKAECQKLLKEGKLSILATSGRYLITYYPSKFFSIDKANSKNFAMFSNMAQYTDTSFVFKKIDKELTIAGAEVAKATGYAVYDALTSIGLHPYKLTSPVAVYQKEVLDNMDIPTDKDLPDENIGKYAYECAKGAWLEAFKIGYWDVAYDYDISSAYAYQLAQLPDTRLGKWIHSKTTLKPDKVTNTLGFFKGRVTMWADFHPILYKHSSTMSYTPTGSWDTYLTGDEWEFIEKYNLGSFEMEDGWWWIPTRSLEGEALVYPLPFKEIITSLHNEKESNGGMKKNVVKRILSGIYGLTLQVFQYEEGQSLGPYFNPVYGALVETRARLEVARFCLDNNFIPCHVAVDGIITDKDLISDKQLKVGHSTNIGTWKLTSVAPTLISSTGAVAIKGKQGTGDFALDYDEIMEFIKANPEAPSYEMKKLSPVTVKSAVDGNFKELGSLKEITRSVMFGEDTKRGYLEEITTGKQLVESQYESIPWDVSLIQ